MISELLITEYGPLICPVNDINQTGKLRNGKAEDWQLWVADADQFEAEHSHPDTQHLAGAGVAVVCHAAVQQGGEGFRRIDRLHRSVIHRDLPLIVAKANENRLLRGCGRGSMRE